MKSFRIIYPMVVVASIFAIAGCEDSIEFRQPAGSDKTPPGVVTNVHVENLAGKAKITYTLPDSKNLLYVKAEYTLASGEVAVAKSSFYKDTIMVEGFADTNDHEVAL